MAIALVASGTRTKADTSASGVTQSVALPAGHLSGHWLLLAVVTEDNTGPNTPSGWSVLGKYAAGASTQVPYVARPHVWLYHRIDNGSLGSSVSLTFSSSSWPAGKPYVLAWTTAYSGADTASPVEIVQANTTTSTAAAQTHPNPNAAVTGDWGIYFRAVNADAAKTFTESGGVNTERVDDTAGFPASPSAVLFDTNAGLTAGAQTQRTSTASATVEYGSVAVTIYLKSASVAGATTAVAQTATATGTAGNVSATTTISPWDLCGGLPAYSVAIDWNNDGDFSDPGEDVTGDNISGLSFSYGRDQKRQLSPASVGTASLSLINVSRTYNPDNPASPLSGDLDAARSMRSQVTFSGTPITLFQGRIDDYNVHSDFTNRTVDFTFLDAMNDLSNAPLSTPVYEAQRAGALINIILDLVGWTAPRQIDLGATILRYWWAEGTNALAAINDLVNAEGPPSIAYVAPDGTFVFHDRHHRIQNSRSTTVQGTFVSSALGECTTAAGSPDDLHFTAPFDYAHGWRDIINSISFDVQERRADADLSAVWTSDDSNITLINGQSTEILISTSDPFIGAVVPVAGTDYTAYGAGTLIVGLDRDSGASAKITLMASGGSVIVQGLQLRARPITVRQNIKIVRKDPGSISAYGERAYPTTSILAGANDADAVASAILVRYAKRRPTVSIRVVTSDPMHFVQILNRTVGDRIHITDGEASVDDDFFVEYVSHTIRRWNQIGKPPVHAVVFGCERAPVQAANPFRFDVRGAGFDDGVFDPLAADNPNTVFIFDQGVFDTHVYGT